MAPSAAAMVSDQSYVSDFQWPAENSINTYQQYYTTGALKGGEMAVQHIRAQGNLQAVDRDLSSVKSVDSEQGDAMEMRDPYRSLWTVGREKQPKRHPQGSLWTVGCKTKSNRFICTQEIMTMNSTLLSHRSRAMVDLL